MEITTSIGRRCKACKGFSRPVLITREAWPVIFSKMLQNCISSVSFRLSLNLHIGVALAEGKHLFPFRTEKLSPPAPMVLPGRLGGRVGRRPLFSSRSPRPGHWTGAFAFSVARSRVPSPPGAMASLLALAPACREPGSRPGAGGVRVLGPGPGACCARACGGIPVAFPGRDGGACRSLGRSRAVSAGTVAVP